MTPDVQFVGGKYLKTIPEISSEELNENPDIEEEDSSLPEITSDLNDLRLVEEEIISFDRLLERNVVPNLVQIQRLHQQFQQQRQQFEQEHQQFKQEHQQFKQQHQQD